jgi:hypothetical protein
MKLFVPLDFWPLRMREPGRITRRIKALKEGKAFGVNFGG